MNSSPHPALSRTPDIGDAARRATAAVVHAAVSHPDWSGSERLASYDGDWSGPGLSWKDIVQVANTPT